MNRFGVHDVLDFTFYDKVTGEPVLTLDTLKMSNMEATAESVYATGGSGNNRLLGWDFGREVLFNLQDALLNPQTVALQTGVDLKKDKALIKTRESVIAEVVDPTNPEGEVTHVKIPLSHVPLAKGMFAYKTANGVTQGEKIDLKDAVVADQAITVPAENLDGGDRVIVHYQFETVNESETIVIDSNKFPAFYEGVGDMVWRNETTGIDERVQIQIPKLKVSSSFSLQMQPDGDPAVFDLDIDVFKEAGETEMVKIIRYDE